ncbi:hypothetical protein ASU31_06000 [Pedobacter ginsenosidimutans]|uniref:Uncharacterized protein n=1 Tax=Pedobacter ginsenosidimutans TaxID=687842 RepID=A0A0T5VTQ8_9SPHI|nr:hypothetical protein [Pedobacter ginsenosidimutans]KRT17222.1 hypothetical protein ASU31_06000 [Pedobacter ginsenosidimutans]
MTVTGISFMSITEEFISTHRLVGKIPELKDRDEIISILKKEKYNITKETTSEICFVLPSSAYSSRYKNRIREGSIVYDHLSGDFEFSYIDKNSLFGFLSPAIFVILCVYNFGWLGFVLPILLITGVSRFSFLFYKNVIGREFISDLKLKPDYP